jgi:hypothetical protein
MGICGFGAIGVWGSREKEIFMFWRVDQGGCFSQLMASIYICHLLHFYNAKVSCYYYVAPHEPLLCMCENVRPAFSQLTISHALLCATTPTQFSSPENKSGLILKRRPRPRFVLVPSPDLTTLIGRRIFDASGYPLISQTHFAPRRKIVSKSRLDCSKADECCR